ncbi:MAG TPA: hypothetical protein VI636_05470 [Candidatus Angelobacter sp.]
MAASNGSGGGWAGVVQELLKTFLILRDIFGYALPGGVFLGIGMFVGRIRMQAISGVISPFHVPTWAAAILIVAGCYAVGHVLASAAYLLSDIGKAIVARKYRAELLDPPVTLDAGVQPRLRWLLDNPTEVTADLLVLRSKQPEIFVDLDRRETMTLLSGALLVALTAGPIIFCWLKLGLCATLLVGAAILVIDFATAFPHLRRVKMATRKAGEKLAAAKPPEDYQKHLQDLLDAATEFLKKH